jgi:hypothetical protein
VKNVKDVTDVFLPILIILYALSQMITIPSLHKIHVNNLNLPNFLALQINIETKAQFVPTIVSIIIVVKTNLS